jgi:hypothetical protein
MLKWWQKLFFWMLEICALNSYILYKDICKEINEKPIAHLQFDKKLVIQLRGDFQLKRKPQGQQNTSKMEKRLDGKLHILGSGNKKDWRVCSNRKQVGGRKLTMTYCSTCPDKPSLNLHLRDCFEKFHNNKN